MVKIIPGLLALPIIGSHASDQAPKDVFFIHLVRQLQLYNLQE